jgi:CheY-like chemotaxis protein
MTRVLLVEEDAHLREEMKRSFEEAGLPTFEASGAAEMSAILATEEGPWIIFHDWSLRDADGLSLCEVIRQTGNSNHAYVIVTGSQLSRADVAQAIRSGADECLHKPIAPDVLRSRLRAALRLVVQDQDPSKLVLDGLLEGVTNGSGELIVKDKDRVFRVLISGHKIVFVNGSGESASLRSALRAHGLGNEELTAAMEEAKNTRQGFFQILLSWGLAGADELRDITRDWIERRMAALVRSEAPQVLFVPRQFKSDGGEFSFELDELLPAECLTRSSIEAIRPPSRNSIVSLTTPLGAWENAIRHLPQSTPEVAELIEQTLQIPGARSVAIIQQKTARCEGWGGEPLEPDVVWPVLSVLSQLERSGDAPIELLFSTRNTFHIVRVLDGTPERACYLVVDRSEGNLGLCRSTFARIIEARRTEQMLA